MTNQQNDTGVTSAKDFFDNLYDRPGAACGNVRQTAADPVFVGPVPCDSYGIAVITFRDSIADHFAKHVTGVFIVQSLNQFPVSPGAR